MSILTTLSTDSCVVLLSLRTKPYLAGGINVIIQSLTLSYLIDI